MLTSTQEELVAEAVKEMVGQIGTTTKTPSGSPSAIYAHGQGGLLSPAGLRRGLANAMILPALGLMDALPKRTSRESNPLLGIVTGVTATTGDEPADRCSDPPVAGLAKLCTHSFTFGWFGRMSRELRLDRFGKMINRSEFDDFTMVGDPFSSPGVPDGQSINGPITATQINTEQGKLLFELSVAMLRDQARDLYTGNPANNTGVTGASGREYYRGLDLLINTGYQDAITQQACPAADSIVRDWGNLDISTNGAAIVKEIAYIMRNLRHIAVKTGLSPVRWALSMREGLFYELTEVWPCSYLSYRCNLSNNTQAELIISSETQLKLRDGMRGDQANRTGQYLLIDGVKVPVILDDAVTETGTGVAGQYSSDIYFVPLNVKGGGGNSPISEGGSMSTYMEYFDFNMPGGTMDGARALAPPGAYQSTANGRWLFHRYYPKNLCVQIAGWTNPRLVLETPYLAARLQNIAYTPLFHEREPFTDDSYFVDGGRTDFLGFGPSFYPPTS